MADLARAVSARQALVAWLRDEYPEADDQTIADTAEGQSTLDLAIASVLREAVEADAIAKALGEMLKQSQDRKRRLEARADKLRAIALRAAEDAALTMPIRAPDLTASIMHGKGSVLVTDEDALPDEYVEIKRVPKKGAIGDALREGVAVAGAMLSNSAGYWLVRRG